MASISIGSEVALDGSGILGLPHLAFGRREDGFRQTSSPNCLPNIIVQPPSETRFPPSSAAQDRIGLG